MKKFLASIAAIFFLPLIASADVGIYLDSTNQGATSKINFIRGGTTAAQNGSLFNVPVASDGLIVTGSGSTGATSMTTAQLAVSPLYSYVRKAIASDPAYSAGTLADGEPGQKLTIMITHVVGGGTWTLTPTTKTGFASILFDAAKEQATLYYINDSVGWVVDAVAGATVNLPTDGT